jgi:hypothetical protein
MLTKLLIDIYRDKPFIVKPFTQDMVFTSNPNSYLYDDVRNKYFKADTRNGRTRFQTRWYVPPLEFCGKGTSFDEATEELALMIKTRLDPGFLFEPLSALIVIPYRDITRETCPFISKKGVSEIRLVTTVFCWYFEL